MRFSNHANERLVERNITREDVAGVLAAPDQIVTQRPHARNFHGRIRDGRAIVVVLADKPADLVITVFADDNEEQP